MRQLLLPAVLVGAAVLLTNASALQPAPAPVGPGAVIHALEGLFETLDAGDATAARAYFGESRTGAGFDADEGFGHAPGALHWLLDEEGATSPACGAEGLDASVAALAAALAGGETRIVRGWGDCGSREASWAALELEHESADGSIRPLRVTGLCTRGDSGFHFYHLHLSPLGDTGARSPVAR